MALLPTGLGSGGKRSRRALGRCRQWRVNGGRGEKRRHSGAAALPSPPFAQLVDDGGDGGEPERDAQVLQVGLPRCQPGTWGQTCLGGGGTSSPASPRCPQHHTWATGASPLAGWEREEVPSHYPAPWSGSATACCRCPRCPLSPPGCRPCRLCPAAGFGGCSARPTRPLHRLGEGKRERAAASPLPTRPPPSVPTSPPGHGHCHSHVTLSPSAAWHTRYLASAPGQVARGDGSHRRTAASALALMWMEEASEAARHRGGQEQLFRITTPFVARPGCDAARSCTYRCR